MTAASYPIVAIFRDGTEPTDGTEALLPYAQDLEFPQWTDGRLSITCFGGNGSAYNVSGGAFIFTARTRNQAATPVISHEGVITSGSGGTAYVDIGSVDTGITVQTLSWSLTFVDSAGKIWAATAVGSFAITAGEYIPGQDVTVPESQQPLGQGPNIGHVADYAHLPAAASKAWLWYVTEDDGKVYYSNGTNWVIDTIGAAYLPLTGGTLTGPLIADSAIKLENPVAFGSPIVHGTIVDGYTSFTADGVGPIWAGTGFTAKANSENPTAAFINFTVNDEVVLTATNLGTFPESTISPQYQLGGSGGADGQSWQKVWAQVYAGRVGSALVIAGGVIAPTYQIHSVGAGEINTITPPFVGFTGTIVLRPTGAITWTAAGNILGSGAGIAGQDLFATFDGSKWSIDGSVISVGIQVMYFDGNPLLTHLNCGQFWKYPFDLGAAFCWDMWAEIMSANGYYVVSDGYGGAHAMLWDGRGGNIFLDAGGGGGHVEFGTDDEPPPNVLSHFRIGLINDDQVTNDRILGMFINGVMCGRVVWPTGRTRATQNPANGAGVLFVGGSDHQNANMRLAWLRVWDRAWPFSTAHPEAAFVPQKFPMSVGSDASLTPCDLLLNCMAADGGHVPDQSSGYEGGDSSGPRGVHHGRSYRVVSGGIVDAGNLIEQPVSFPIPAPQRMLNTPLDATAWPTSPPNRSLSPGVVPGGARIFDSFARADQTYAHSAIPTLGSTEGGSRGALAWTQFVLSTSGTGLLPSRWGIFNGRAVCFEPYQPSGAVVDNVAADMDVRVTRRKGTWGSGETGLVFRYIDNQNWWSIYYTNRPDSGNDGIFFYGYWEAGSWTRVGYVIVAADVAWSVLRVTVVGDTITFYTDSTQRATFSNSKFSGATKVGIGTASDVFPSSQSSLARWDDFTVY